MMDGITCLGRVVVDDPAATGAPGDGAVSGDIGFNLVVPGLRDDGVPFPRIRGVGRVRDVQGEVGCMPAIIRKGVPIGILAGGIGRVELWVLDHHHDRRGCL